MNKKLNLQLNMWCIQNSMFFRNQILEYAKDKSWWEFKRKDFRIKTINNSLSKKFAK